MELIIQAITVFFDYLLKPFSFFPPYVGLCFISAVTGVLFLKLFWLFSNQEKIRRAKGQIKAHLLGIVLYRDDMRTSLKLQAKLLNANLKYLTHSLPSLLILFLICIPILGQLNIRYGYRPLAVGEKLILTVQLDNASVLNNISITTADGLKVLTPPLRILKTGEVDWKLQGLKQGRHVVEVSTPRENYTKEIVVGSEENRIFPNRSKSLLSSILYPGDRLLPKRSELTSIKVNYPKHYVKIFSYDFHWLLVFCVVSILTGLSFKRVLKVEI
jgi:hypothetical protein